MDIRIDDLNYIVKQKSIDKTILKNISFNVDGQNQIVGVIGANGSGKTSLLRHIHRQLKTHNSVFINGKDINDYDGKQFAKLLAVMNQEEEQVDAQLTVKDIVLMSRYAYTALFSYYSKEDLALVDEIISSTGLSGFEERKFSTLSGGEKQRVLLAKALAQGTDIIILDEPTNHMDIKYKLELMEILKRHKGLIIMTLHDLNLVSKYCDRIIALKNGAIKVDGGVDDVFKTDVLPTRLIAV